MKALIAREASYIYPDGTAGITEATVDVEGGERVALIGANGSGKSTLLLLFSGLLKPVKGEIKILGRSVDRKNSKFFRRNIGILFQNPDDFLFNPTVKDELLYTPAQLEIDENKAIEMAERYARMFNIDKFFDKPPFRLSGGEKKKVALACVLMMEPKILLLDEPTANIDGKTRRKIIEMIDSINTTLVIATHELDFIDKLADRVVMLNMEKRVIADGGLELLDDRDLLEKAGII
ncbi:MAG TPA: ABC transporter ATP-binding protein [Archaeoglobaceae archaeon]|nr:ABC transporter ATP-binding protein [Archaeoglobaceae archaeon]